LFLLVGTATPGAPPQILATRRRFFTRACNSSSVKMGEPWNAPNCKAPSYYAELFETDQRATILLESGAVWPCLYPSFKRLNLPFGTMGMVTDAAVSDYHFVQYGKSPAPMQIRGAPDIEPIWGAFRDKMMDLSKSKIPAACVCCCISCCTAAWWQPCFISGYGKALQALIEEQAPHFAAAGVRVEFFDRSDFYSFTVKTSLSAKYGSSHMNVVGVTLEMAQTASPTQMAVPLAAVQIERS